MILFVLGERAGVGSGTARAGKGLALRRLDGRADDAGFRLFHGVLLLAVDWLLCTIGKNLPTYTSSHVHNKSQFLIDPASLRMR